MHVQKQDVLPCNVMHLYVQDTLEFAVFFTLGFRAGLSQILGFDFPMNLI